MIRALLTTNLLAVIALAVMGLLLRRARLRVLAAQDEHRRCHAAVLNAMRQRGEKRAASNQVQEETP